MSDPIEVSMPAPEVTIIEAPPPAVIDSNPPASVAVNDALQTAATVVEMAAKIDSPEIAACRAAIDEMRSQTSALAARLEALENARAVEAIEEIIEEEPEVIEPTAAIPVPIETIEEKPAEIEVKERSRKRRFI